MGVAYNLRHLRHYKKCAWAPLSVGENRIKNSNPFRRYSGLQLLQIECSSVAACWLTGPAAWALTIFRREWLYSADQYDAFNCVTACDTTVYIVSAVWTVSGQIQAKRVIYRPILLLSYTPSVGPTLIDAQMSSSSCGLKATAKVPSRPK